MRLRPRTVSRRGTDSPMKTSAPSRASASPPLTLRGFVVLANDSGELEAHAAAHGATAVQLETNRTLVEAIRLYKSAGFVEIEPYNDEYYAHHWFEKQLTPKRD